MGPGWRDEVPTSSIRDNPPDTRESDPTPGPDPTPHPKGHTRSLSPYVNPQWRIPPPLQGTPPDRSYRWTSIPDKSGLEEVPTSTHTGRDVGVVGEFPSHFRPTYVPVDVPTLHGPPRTLTDLPPLTLGTVSRSLTWVGDRELRW